MVTETKLRDLIAGAQADAGGNEEAVIDLVMRRLGQAMLIELDDGTVFVRRPRLRPLEPRPAPHTYDGRPCYACGKVHNIFENRV